MQLETKIPFRIDDVDGDLLLSYTPFRFQLFQNGTEVKRKGLAGKFPVKTTDGGTEILTLEKGFDFTFRAVFRGQKTQLEERLSTLDYVIALAPVAVLVPLGGLFGALFGLLGGTITCAFMRIVKNPILKIVITLVVGAIVWALYLAFSLAFRTALGR